MVVLKRDVSCASLVVDQAWDLGLGAQKGLGPYLLIVLDVKYSWLG